MGLGTLRVENTHSAVRRSGSMPGALDRTWRAPCGNMTMSPVASFTGGWPATAAQPLPLAIMWYSMTCSQPGITASAISPAGGASVDQGSLLFLFLFLVLCL